MYQSSIDSSLRAAAGACRALACYAGTGVGGSDANASAANRAGGAALDG